MFPVFSRGRALDLCSIVVMSMTLACFGGGTPTPVSIPQPVAGTPPDSFKTSATRSKLRPRPHPRSPVDSAVLERAVTTRLAHRPLALALARRSGNPAMADRAAEAVVHEAGRLRMSPSLLAAVLLIENTPLDTGAVSSQGAIGLMQVMPVHAGSYGCPSEDLVNVESNICHGARLLHNMLRRTQSMALALKRYNGCVRGRNTPRCYRYPVRVLRTASRIRREVLVTAGDSSIGTRVALASRPGRPLVPIATATATAGDPSVTEVAATNECSTFFRCLRYRWTIGR